MLMRYYDYMEVLTLHRGDAGYPRQLTAMHRPPGVIYSRGGDLQKLLQRPRVAIVGSRLPSAYGKHVTQKLAQELAAQGVVIVSGLALGIDALAHQAALDAGGLALAVLPCPVESVVPTTNYRLSERIVASGGALVSQYAKDSENHKGNFVARNEMVVALSDLIVIPEAAHKSGSLHTASFARDLGVDVLSVPGNITSPVSAGTNQLIKSGSSGVATCTRDVLRLLGLADVPKLSALRGDTPQEQTVLDLIGQGNYDGQALHAASRLSAAEYNQVLTMLEIAGKIMPLGGNHWGLA